MTRAAISSFDVTWYALRRERCSGLPTSVENATAPLWAPHGYQRVYLYGAPWLRGLGARVTP
jgi:hypothetical protein